MYNFGEVRQMQKTCAIYTRVSTEEQARTGLSLGVQEETCRRIATEAGYLVTEVFTDEGLTGRNTKRPQFQSLCRRLSEFDVIYALRLDRYSRSPKDMFFFIDQCAAAKTQIKAVHSSIDLSSPMGRAMVGVSVIFAALEAELTQERVLETMEDIVRQGRKLGFAPYGYRLPGPKQVIVPDPEESKIVQHVFAEYGSGKSLIEICRHLNADGILSPTGKAVWHTGTVRNMLTRETYIGKVVHRRTGNVVDGLHEAIISRELFERCRRRVEQNRRVNTKSRSGSLSSLLRCGYCGGNLSIVMGRNGETRNYHCRSRRLMQDRHEPVFIVDRVIEGYIWLLVGEIASEEAKSVFQSQLALVEVQPTSQLEALQEERFQLETEVKYLLRAASKINLSLDVLAEQTRPLQQRLEEVQRELHILTDRPGTLSGIDFQEELAAVRASGYQQQREFLEKLFCRVEVFRDRIVFHPSVGSADTLTISRQRLGGTHHEAMSLRVL